MVGLPSPGETRLVYVVEPHPIAALHLAATLKRYPGVEVVACDLSLRGLPSLPSKHSVLIIDTGALPFPFVPFLRAVRARFGDQPILAIAGGAPDDDLCRLLSIGVGGFVAYDKVEEDICAAVRNLLKGHLCFPPQVLERCAVLSSALQRQARAKDGVLSSRESQVVGLLQRRLSNKEIGSALGISERTVRFHLHNAFEKLGVHDRSSAMELAQPAGPLGSRKGVPVWETA